MGCPLNPEEIMEDFQSFYFDTALSSTEVNLAAMDKFVGFDRLLFGTDFPGAIELLKTNISLTLLAAVSTSMSEWYNSRLKEHYAKAEDGAMLQSILRINATKLFPRFASLSLQIER